SSCRRSRPSRPPAHPRGRPRSSRRRPVCRCHEKRKETGMHTKRRASLIAYLGFVLLLLWTFPLYAQTTFSSGSNGSLGAFNPTSNTTVTLPADGVLNYTTINIPSDVTVTFTPNATNTPVTMLATGDVTISGTI